MDKRTLIEMKNILTSEQARAILEVKEKLLSVLAVKEIVLFGSYARREADELSDIDLLIITDHKLSHQECDIIAEIIFEINLNYETNISFVPVDASSWYGQRLHLSALYSEVQRDGVVV
ncbi:nucleotidyltransferase domain-containing protein [Heliorestis acidaminivorans]|uniref:Nucleotidyltransferase domain-containing protein n=1 Tax=Heliorestis acidaminivorans TaxID=553427 RepID=A0A6I0ETU2_9FIRM|nr:nucleotidyltransferase domain-containing protein [Heliorestis acidaminivorans]KAB2950555.1 nucleotidyltransferase domain-containing protein [Heliorestis acidaminivorans]